MSASTNVGEWNAPTMFLASGRSHPVLPPVEASTIASSEVGTLIQRMPRIHAAAAKPVMSPTTPPPTATAKSPRPSSAERNARQMDMTVSIVFVSSPAGMVSPVAAKPALRSDARTRSP